MKVLIACEESQTVCKAFRAKGHEAYSCDIIEPSGGHPEWHIWRKTNPSPMNGQHIYLSGIENAVWFKKRGGVFNAHCKNTVFDYP